MLQHSPIVALKAVISHLRLWPATAIVLRAQGTDPPAGELFSYVFSGSWITMSNAAQIVRRKRQNINHDVTDFLGGWLRIMRHAGSQIRTSEMFKSLLAKSSSRARLPAIAGAKNYPARFFSRFIASI